ncbi:2-component regulator [Shigella flexneri]|nr:2-component regulator [Shigella flexneri]
MVNHQHNVARVLNNGALGTNFVVIELQQRAVAVDAADPQNAEIKAELGDKIERLRYNWQESRPSALTALLGAEAENIDLFDRMQLEHVIAICRQAKSLSAAGRQLFDVSRQGKASVNDADRLRKYLARFGLTWEAVQDQHSSS